MAQYGLERTYMDKHLVRKCPCKLVIVWLYDWLFNLKIRSSCNFYISVL